MTRASTVAEFILRLQEQEPDITNLKLQKLLYYAQGFHVVLAGEPLFADDIEPWDNGPVVPAVWRSYKEFGSKPLVASAARDDAQLLRRSESIVREVYVVFNKFTAWTLRNMTHAEPPWLNTYKRTTVISIEELRRYFLTQILAPDDCR